MEEIGSICDVAQRETLEPSERFKVVVKDLTEKALEIVNRISVNEISKSEPQADLIEDYYLLYHYLNFLKRFFSSRK